VKGVAARRIRSSRFAPGFGAEAFPVDIRRREIHGGYVDGLVPEERVRTRSRLAVKGGVARNPRFAPGFVGALSRASVACDDRRRA